MKFTFTVEVDTDTAEHAAQVMSERLACDEQYADESGGLFDYTVNWSSGHRAITDTFTPEWFFAAIEGRDNDAAIAAAPSDLVVTSIEQALKNNYSWLQDAIDAIEGEAAMNIESELGLL